MAVPSIFRQHPSVLEGGWAKGGRENHSLGRLDAQPRSGRFLYKTELLADGAS